MRVQVGCSIRAILCQQLGLSPQFVEERIKTVFLDGKPVDDIDSTIINEGSTLALSAAMPGLAGATLRRGGYLASFRSQITHRKDETFIRQQEGFINLKLFNLMMEELGPTLLQRGILIRKEVAKDFLRNLPKDFWLGCKAPIVEGKEVDVDELLKMDWAENKDLVLIRVQARDCIHP